MLYTFNYIIFICKLHINKAGGKTVACYDSLTIENPWYESLISSFVLFTCLLFHTFLSVQAFSGVLKLACIASQKTILNFEEFCESVDVMLVAWKPPWSKYLHHRNWKTAQVWSSLLESQLLNIYHHSYETELRQYDITVNLACFLHFKALLSGKENEKYTQINIKHDGKQFLVIITNNIYWVLAMCVYCSKHSLGNIYQILKTK